MVYIKYCSQITSQTNRYITTDKLWNIRKLTFYAKFLTFKHMGMPTNAFSIEEGLKYKCAKNRYYFVNQEYSKHFE